MPSKREILSPIAGILLLGVAYGSAEVVNQYNISAKAIERQIKEKKERILNGLGVEVPALYTAASALELGKFDRDGDKLPFFEGPPAADKVEKACGDMSDRIRAESCGVALTAVNRTEEYRQAVASSDISVYQRAAKQEHASASGFGIPFLASIVGAGYFLKRPVQRVASGAIRASRAGLSRLNAA